MLKWSILLHWSAETQLRKESENIVTLIYFFSSYVKVREVRVKASDYLLSNKLWHIQSILSELSFLSSFFCQQSFLFSEKKQIPLLCFPSDVEHSLLSFAFCFITHQLMVVHITRCATASSTLQSTSENDAMSWIVFVRQGQTRVSPVVRADFDSVVFSFALGLWRLWLWSCTKCIYHPLHSTIRPLYESQSIVLYL